MQEQNKNGRTPLEEAANNPEMTAEMSDMGLAFDAQATAEYGSGTRASSGSFQRSSRVSLANPLHARSAQNMNAKKASIMNVEGWVIVVAPHQASCFCIPMAFRNRQESRRYLVLTGQTLSVGDTAQLASQQGSEKVFSSSSEIVSVRSCNIPNHGTCIEIALRPSSNGEQ